MINTFREHGDCPVCFVTKELNIRDCPRVRRGEEGKTVVWRQRSDVRGKEIGRKDCGELVLAEYENV